MNLLFPTQEPRGGGQCRPGGHCDLGLTSASWANNAKKAVEHIQKSELTQQLK